MIARSLEEIQEADLQALIDNKVPEGKAIEYKRELPGGTDGEKIKFLRAVSSFGNTEGGDLLYGVEAVDGIPVALATIGHVNQDELKLKLEGMCRDGLEPRLPKIDFQFVPTTQGQVLLIRVPKSWISPHRVKFSGHGHFYGRNSAGVYQLDVGQLRITFTMSESIAERIRNFRFERLSKLHDYQTPVPMLIGCKMALHIIPLSAFSGSERIDVAQHHQTLSEFRPLGSSGPHHFKINLDGVLNYTIGADGRSRAYTQVFRKGIVEAVAVFTEYAEGIKRIHSKQYEDFLITALSSYLNILEAAAIPTPIFAFLSFVGITDYLFIVPEGPQGVYGVETRRADRDVLALPEVVIGDYGAEAHKVLRPAFDMVWNAFGYAASANYDPAGNWVG